MFRALRGNETTMSQKGNAATYFRFHDSFIITFYVE